MHSRYEIGIEQYVLTRRRRGQPRPWRSATTTILPAALRYQTELATNVAALRPPASRPTPRRSRRSSAPIAALRAGLADLRRRRSHERTTTDRHRGGDLRRDVVLPAMAAVRAAADTLEALVADDLWPLPTYQEMLFIL